MYLALSPEVESTPKWKEVNKGDQNEESKEESQQKLVSEHAHKLNGLLDQAEGAKKEGNDFYKAKEYEKAIDKYSKVFAFTRSIVSGEAEEGDTELAEALQNTNSGEEGEILKARAKNLERDANNNLARIYLVQKQWEKAIEKTTDSLNIEKTSKGYFRRGKAYAESNKFEEALKDFMTGKEQFPEDAKEFDSEIAKTKELENQYTKAQITKFAPYIKL